MLPIQTLEPACPSGSCGYSEGLCFGIELVRLPAVAEFNSNKFQQLSCLIFQQTKFHENRFRITLDFVAKSASLICLLADLERSDMLTTYCRCIVEMAVKLTKWRFIHVASCLTLEAPVYDQTKCFNGYF